MSRKKKTWFVSAIIAIAAFVFVCRAEFPSQNQPSRRIQIAHAPHPSKPSMHPSARTTLMHPWDSYQPLTDEERREFEGAAAQVHKFLSWGNMDPAAVPAFRQTLFKIGDRGVAELARELAQITPDELQNRAAAAAVVQRIDVLAYFADSSNPLAADSVAVMARRPVNWNDAGELLNPVEANITFEMSDIFAKLRPADAVAHISTLEKTHRPAYFTRYAYGRKLAGKTMEDIDLELRGAFGSPELALQ